MTLFRFFTVLLLVIVSTSVRSQTIDSELISVELYNDKIERSGKLDYKRTLSLSFKNQGYLAQLDIDEGERFEKGQLLATLDITELQENKNANYAQLQQAKREVKRISQLMKNNLASERDLDMAITQVDTSRAAYQLTYYNLEKARLYAPFSGVVLRRNADLGELQNPGQEVLKIAKLEGNWVVKVALTGNEISRVQLKQNVQVALANLGFINGTISKIPAIADEGSNLFTIEVLLPSLKLSSGVISGQLASIKIAFESENYVYRLPINSLVTVNENGAAAVVSKLTSEASFSLENFKVFDLDNNYIYVEASQSSPPLTVMTKGWQNFISGGQQ